MQNINIIVAMNQDHIIGVDNQLPWHVPEDLKFFKEVTLGKPVIMGRKTLLSIGRALPKRQNIVITRNKDFTYPGVISVTSLEEALNLTKLVKEVFVIGGGEIFELALPIANKLYLTIIDTKVKGNVTCFPEIDYTEWELVNENPVVTANGIKCCFKEYMRRESK